MGYKAIILILLFASLLDAQIILNPKRSDILSPPTGGGGGATPLTTLDFEEGDLSDFNDLGNIGSAVASTTVKHGGSYSMRVPTNSLGVYTFSAETEVWLTFWVYFPSTSSQSGTTNYIAMFNWGNDDRSCIGTNNSPWDEWLPGVNSGNLTDGDYTTGFATDTWIKVKTYYKTNGVNLSNHQVWINDTSIWSDTDVFINSATNFSCGSEVATITNYFYIDDIKLYDQDPGTQD